MLEPAAINHRYMLGELIGAGGMGCVYAAADGSGSSLAVKLLNTALADDPSMVTRLVEEAQITRRVSHQNVIRVVDDGITADGAPFLVMNRVNGTPLRVLIQNEGPLALSRVREIAAQMLAGLAAIHGAGLVHGDIKSANVLVERTAGADRVTIIDFGLARSLGTAPLAAEDRAIAGTPDYMAPELIRGEPASVASDLYAVGVVLYEMVTGTTPFGGGTVTEIFERQLAEAPVPPSSRCDDRALPAALERAIMRALDKTAVHRHDDAQRFAAELARSLPDGSDDRVASPWQPAASFTDAPTCDWIRSDADAMPEPRHRLAEGTLAQERAHVRDQRDELRDSLASNQREPIVVAYLGLARALVDDADCERPPPS